MLTNGILLYHDNARPHTAAATAQTIRKLKFEFSPTQRTVQISPHLITVFSDWSKIRCVDACLQTVKGLRTRCTWLRAQPKTLFSDGIRMLVDRVTKCMEKREECRKVTV